VIATSRPWVATAISRVMTQSELAPEVDMILVRFEQRRLTLV
jgi:hypothetical protein